MFLKDISKIQTICVISLIVFGVFGRLFLINYVAMPNFEIITALTLVGAVFLGRLLAIIVPLSILAITDVIIGNSPVLIFTWSAFAIIGVLGVFFRSIILSAEKRNKKCFTSKLFTDIRQKLFFMFGMTILGVVSSLFFFLYTNFGWWLMSNMYPHTWGGLIQCYIMGLPFLKNNLIGNLIFVPIFSNLALYLIYFKINYSLKLYKENIITIKLRNIKFFRY